MIARLTAWLGARFRITSDEWWAIPMRRYRPNRRHTKFTVLWNQLVLSVIDDVRRFGFSRSVLRPRSRIDLALRTTRSWPWL